MSTKQEYGALGAFKVLSGYDGSKGQYRNPANVAEMFNWCSTHSHIQFIDTHGKMRNCKVNGKVKTWNVTLTVSRCP